MLSNWCWHQFHSSKLEMQWSNCVFMVFDPVMTVNLFSHIFCSSYTFPPFFIIASGAMSIFIFLMIPCSLTVCGFVYDILYFPQFVLATFLQHVWFNHSLWCLSNQYKCVHSKSSEILFMWVNINHFVPCNKLKLTLIHITIYVLCREDKQIKMWKRRCRLT